MSEPLPAPVRVFLGGPALARLWDVVAERLQRTGLQAQGRVRLSAPAPEERAELALLLCGVRHTGDVTVDLAVLDAKLRDSPAGCGLVEVTEALRGPLVDRPARRAQRDAERSRIWAGARQALAAAGIQSSAWAETWLDEIRRGGSTGRLRPQVAEDLIAQAIQVLARLTRGAGTRDQGRGDLAALITGSAHGLDDDTLLSRLVLRGLALARDVPLPTEAEGRRALWTAAGVIVDEVSATVLTYGLRPVGDTVLDRHLCERADLHAPAHLTVRDLRAWRPRLPGGARVHVFENPRVLEAAADAAAGTPLVCASGSPSTVVLALLDGLTAGGAELAYHGDFDWPGVALTARMATRYGARPWRMSAQDYESAVQVAQDRGTPLLPLNGEPVSTPWDPELSAAMSALGAAVHEESVLETLLDELG
ncbi:MAG: TIGR02679 family protein [Streptosporangiales bacterium]|nr:TIGR02679 family protein [Streptosporangiales bacterium]